MKYIALLRGINVGGKNKVEMKKLKDLFATLGFYNISTYLNSGNIIFESKVKPIQKTIESRINEHFKVEITTLIKSETEMKAIANAIPKEWKNDTEQKTDVAYLFEESDREGIIDELNIAKEYIDIRYVKGAIFWNVLRSNYNKSKINKLIQHKLYKSMTVRNVNTARFLGNLW